jgi:hypothetical protein
LLADLLAAAGASFEKSVVPTFIPAGRAATIAAGPAPGLAARPDACGTGRSTRLHPSVLQPRIIDEVFADPEANLLSDALCRRLGLSGIA